MEQIRKFSDSRLEDYCVYCGSGTNTRDHIPSRVLLDEPYPENLPVVPACAKCNQGFSLDEEYIACLIECVVCGSTNPDDLQRAKVKRILLEKPELTGRIKAARHETKSGVQFSLESARCHNVVMKLARGHAAFENSEPQLDDPSSVWFRPLLTMSEGDRISFESTGNERLLLPEVGSRALQRVVSDMNLTSHWLIVQPERYRYFTDFVGTTLTVRIVISEYLACEVMW